MQTVRIETARFLLRSLTPRDATETYSKWFDEPDLAKYIAAARAPHDVESLRRYITEKAEAPDVLFLGIFGQQDHIHIGNLKFEPIDRTSGHAVVGLMIGDPEWRNRGVAAEVIHAAASWLHCNLGIAEIALGVARDNVPAHRAYQKAGFVFASRPYLHVDETYALTMVMPTSGGLPGAVD